MATGMVDDAPYQDLEVAHGSDDEALAQWRRALGNGTPWHLALLDAMALWNSAEETYQGQHYRYLIAGEAFDWLRLAERLCNPMMELLPREEVEPLLFYGQLPLELEEEEFQRRIGSAKYRAHLNFFYGVIVEQALILAVEDEIRKEAAYGNLLGPGRERGDPYQRIYGLPHDTLLACFRAEASLPAQGSLSLDDLHAFIYWLFKYRLTHCDRARIASDTKKGLNKLHHLRRHLRPPRAVPREGMLTSV